ncbi:MAG: class B sortase [Lachnospiraceae bacterium]|nr:class B sortase [Lachnospiraceae bacterium]
MSKENKSKKGLQIVIWLILVVGIGCAGYGCWYFYEELQQEKAQADVSTAVKKTTLEEIESAEFTGITDGDAPELPGDITTGETENPIDFDKLTSYNDELYAWIHIPNTEIDYPVAQHDGEQDYYLKHDMYGEAAFAGCIYTEDCNSKEFTDPNTLIYGHNMRNGSMFQNLHLFEDAEFFEDNQYVYIYTPRHMLTYHIFAAYEYDDRHIMNSFDFTDEKVYADYLDSIFSTRSMNANIREDEEVTADDKIITLSTCVGGNTEARYLVQAVLVKDEKTK